MCLILPSTRSNHSEFPFHVGWIRLWLHSDKNVEFWLSALGQAHPFALYTGCLNGKVNILVMILSLPYRKDHTPFIKLDGGAGLWAGILNNSYK